MKKVFLRIQYVILAGHRRQILAVAPIQDLVLLGEKYQVMEVLGL